MEKTKDGSLKVNGEAKTAPKKRGRWDQTVEESPVPAKKKTLGVSTTTTSSSAATPLWDADVIHQLMLFILKVIMYFCCIENTSRSSLG